MCEKNRLKTATEKDSEVRAYLGGACLSIYNNSRDVWIGSPFCWCFSNFSVSAGQHRLFTLLTAAVSASHLQHFISLMILLCGAVDQVSILTPSR